MRAASSDSRLAAAASGRKTCAAAAASPMLSSQVDSSRRRSGSSPSSRDLRPRALASSSARSRDASQRASRVADSFSPFLSPAARATSRRARIAHSIAGGPSRRDRAGGGVEVCRTFWTLAAVQSGGRRVTRASPTSGLASGSVVSSKVIALPLPALSSNDECVRQCCQGTLPCASGARLQIKGTTPGAAAPRSRAMRGHHRLLAHAVSAQALPRK